MGIRLRDVIGVDRLMWGSDYPHSESTFPRSREVLSEILEGVPMEEQASIVGGGGGRTLRVRARQGSRAHRLTPAGRDPGGLPQDSRAGTGRNHSQIYSKEPERCWIC